jgi:hypothetical protein
MTLEEIVVARSYLPADGTYTILEHLMAMQINIMGSYVDVPTVAVTTTYTTIEENRVTLVVKEGIIRVNISPVSKSSTITAEGIKIKVQA